MKEKQLVPEYIQKLKTYKAGKPIEELAREKGLTKISKLASNENPLGPSPFAVKEMTLGLWDIHRYPDMYAHDIKKSLCKLYNVKPSNIILGNGSEGIMAYIARAFIQPGDLILTSKCTFIGFSILAQGAGAKIIETPLTEDYRYDVRAMAKKIKSNPKVKVIYIANPNNPTGTYITKEEFDFLMSYVPSHVVVILDEAYFEFATLKDDYPNSMDYRYDNVITLRTFSKAYGLSGIRLGYGFAHKDFIKNLTKVKLPFEPNLIAQLGGRGALYDQPHLERTLRNNQKRYNETFKYLLTHQFKPIPSITNFITFKTGSTEASNWLFNALLEEGIIIRPLGANGMPGHVRVSLGTKEEMIHFFVAMDNILPKFNVMFRKHL